MKKRLTVLAVLVAAALVVSGFAIPSMAAESAEPVTETAQSEAVTIVREDESLRGEYEKHFLMSDGTYQAVVYSEPVHTMVDGAWVETDNVMTADADIGTDSDRMNILDNYVMEGSGVQNNNLDRLYIGTKSGCLCRGFIQFKTMPTIPEGSTITSATMTLDILDGTAVARNASAYMVEEAWVSGELQWSNQPDATVLLAADISHNEQTKYVFSCVDAVRHWYDGDPTGMNENYGIMVKYHDETLINYNSFYSADCAYESKRPLIEITYEPPTDEVSVLEGYTKALTVTGVSGTLTWTSSNTAVATVDSSGVVTGIKAGKTTVTASVGDTVYQTFTVYVRIANGAYYIKNGDSLCLGTSGQVADGTPVSLYTKVTTGIDQLNQLWKINYLGSGYYSVRPMYYLSMVLGYTGETVGISTAGTTDTLSGVPVTSWWTIEYDVSGYLFKHLGQSSKTLRCSGAYPSASITAEEYSAANASSFRWNTEIVTSVTNQVLLIDTQTGDSAEGVTRYIEPGETVTMADLGIAASFVCAYETDQKIEWESSNETGVPIDTDTGTVTSLTAGATTQITAKHRYNGLDYGKSFTVVVAAVPSGTYLIKSGAYDKFLQIDHDDVSNGYGTAGSIMEQWPYDWGDYQKWSFTLLSDGYYSITSVQSGLALSVKSGQTGLTDAFIVQEAYSGYDRQKWRITITDDGRCKIKAKSAEGLSDDLVMAVAYSADDADGTYILQREYADDTNYRDEWKLLAFGTDVFLLGVNDEEEGHDHCSVYGEIMPNLYRLGYNGFNCVITDDISIADTQNYMEQCKVFVSRGHGSFDSDQTYISLSKSTDNYIGSWHVYFYLIDEAMIDLSNCDLMLFVGCYTAAVEGTSLPDAAVDAGATYAIGFENEIHCGPANDWTKRFFDYYVQGYSIELSAQMAAEECDDSGGMDSYRVVS